MMKANLRVRSFNSVELADVADMDFSAVRQMLVGSKRPAILNEGESKKMAALRICQKLHSGDKDNAIVFFGGDFFYYDAFGKTVEYLEMAGL